MVHNYRYAGTRISVAALWFYDSTNKEVLWAFWPKFKPELYLKFPLAMRSKHTHTHTHTHTFHVTKPSAVSSCLTFNSLCLCFRHRTWRSVLLTNRVKPDTTRHYFYIPLMLHLNRDRWSVSVSHRKLKHFPLPWPRSILISISRLFLFLVRQTYQWGRASSFTRFLDHTHRCTTVARTPLDEWSTRSRNLYLTCPRWDSNPQSRQVSGRRPKP
jgi:hypothetical protein